MIEAYRQGFFPMAEVAHDVDVQWIRPQMRGQLSIADLHIPRSLKKALRRGPFEVRVNHDFGGVIHGCAAATHARPETWINAPITRVFCELHEMGLAHSVECWDAGQLVGGLYGLSLGGAFFGESMFSKAPNASKIALVHLAARLWQGGFSVLDTQFVNPHLEQFGIYEVPHEAYMDQLAMALTQEPDFDLGGMDQEAALQAYLAFRSESRG